MHAHDVRMGPDDPHTGVADGYRDQVRLATSPILRLVPRRATSNRIRQAQVLVDDCVLQDHLGMTKDAAFSDNVLFLLLEQAR